MKKLEIREATMRDLRKIPKVNLVGFCEFDFEKIKKYRRRNQIVPIVATLDREVVGHLTLFREPNLWKKIDGKKRGDFNFVLANFWVSEDLRGHGIGGRMIEFCKKLARKEKADHFRIDSTGLENPARRLYERYARKEEACYVFI